jgi:hypothetical protein
MKTILLFLVAATITAAALLPSSTVNARNCDKATLDANPADNVRGNAHCVLDSNGDGDGPEPYRDCTREGGSETGHKNSFKDNDNDGTASCVFRGDFD